MCKKGGGDVLEVRGNQCIVAKGRMGTVGIVPVVFGTQTGMGLTAEGLGLYGSWVFIIGDIPR